MAEIRIGGCSLLPRLPLPALHCANFPLRPIARWVPSVMPKSTRRRATSGAYTLTSFASAARRAPAPNSPTISLDPPHRTMAALPAHDLGPAASAFREEVRAWLAQHWTA